MSHNFDNRLQKILAEEVEKEKAMKKKKKPSYQLRKEKRLMYYSGWNKDDTPAGKNECEGHKNH